MISGTGIDLTDITRIAGIIAKWEDRFLQKVYTEKEQEYCRRHALPARHYAAMFAAKEACLKSLGVGMGMGVRWRDMEVWHDKRGKPEIKLTNRAKQLADERGIKTFHVSLSHTDQVAAALVVAETER